MSATLNSIAFIKASLKALGVILLLSVASIPSCITTTNQTPKKVDLKKAEQSHVQAGLAYLGQRNKESARRHFQEAVEINPKSAGGHNGLALVYQGDGEPQLTEKHFQKALSIDPNFSMARNNYSAFLFQKKRYQDAEKQLLRVVKDLTYDHRDASLLNLGRTQIRLGKDTEAIKTLTQALGINFYLPLAHIELASLYFKREEYPAAQQFLEQFKKQARQTPQSLWLGVRLERIFGNKDKEASYAMALKNQHPYSAEYLEYQKTIP